MSSVAVLYVDSTASASCLHRMSRSRSHQLEDADGVIQPFHLLQTGKISYTNRIAFDSVSSVMECQTCFDYNPSLFFCQEMKLILKKSSSRSRIIELTIKSYRPYCAVLGVYGFQAL
jgi:hypothetical protein